MLKIDSLNAAYGNIRVLKEVSLQVPAGKVVSIIGANGAGKSTLLKSISGLMKSSTGRILYKDRNIAGMPANRIVGLGISQVPEGRQLFAHLTVLDNIRLGAYHYFKFKVSGVSPAAGCQSTPFDLKRNFGRPSFIRGVRKRQVIFSPTTLFPPRSIIDLKPLIRCGSQMISG
jgi:ABC-type branched-subunit amino acid transport system ATPase component